MISREIEYEFELRSELELSGQSVQQITNHKSYGQRNLSANHKSQKLQDKGNSRNSMKLSFLGGEEKVFSEKATLGKVKFFFRKREKSRIESQYFDT